MQIDKDKIASKEELTQRLDALYAANHEQKILISADRESRHGDVMACLGKIRQAGFQKVAFAIKKEGGAIPSGEAPSAAPTAPSAPDATAAPAATAPAAPPAPAAPAAPAAPTPPAGQ